MQMFYKGQNHKSQESLEEDNFNVLSGNLGMFACFERVEQKNGKIKKEEKHFFIKPNASEPKIKQIN